MIKRVIGKIDPSDKHVHIWGAGFSGLVLAYYLKDQGFRVTIYERSNKAGGKIQSKKKSTGIIECGPNALYLNQDGLELLKELKLEPIPAAKKLKRLILLNGRPRRPLQLGLFSRVGVNVHKKPPLITDGLTVAEFFRPLLGAEKIDHLVTPVLSGIYAAEAQHLHFKSVFDDVGDKAQFASYWDFLKLLYKNQKAKPKLDVSGSVSFEGGMQTFINRLSDILRNDIKYNYKEPFKFKGNTVICTDAIAASELTKEVFPEISTELGRIRYQEISSTTVHLKREIRPLHRAFGVLIPRDAGFRSTGVLNNKAIFPTNNENVFSYTFISPKKMEREDLVNDIKLLQGDVQPEDIEEMESTHWEKGLPIYDLQRYLSVKKLHQITHKNGHLAFFGNYVAGISLREMISAARSFAQAPTEYSEIP